MKTITRLLATTALLFGVLGGASFVKAYTVVTKTPVLLTGGKFGECFVSGTYFIQMQGWQNIVVYENADGISFDDDSYLQFDLAETVNEGSVRVQFKFSDGSELDEWWCLGIGETANDTNLPYNHDFDDSKYWLKKGLGENYNSKKSLKITKVKVRNWGTENVVTYKINGGTICGQPLTIKQDNAQVFGAYGGVFTATDAQSNIFKLENFAVGDYQKMVIKFGAAVPTTGGWKLNNNSGLTDLFGKEEYEFDLDGTAISDFTIFNWDADPDPINITEVYLYKEEECATLTFDENGKGVISKEDLSANGGLTYNSSTGVLTSDGTEGKLVLIFEEPVDLRNLKHFNVVRSGATGTDDIVNRLKYYDENGTEIYTWNSIKWSNTWNPSGIDNAATNAFINHNPVKKLVWESDEDVAKASLTLTITSVEFMLKTLSCSRAGETQLKNLAWNKIDGSGTATPNWNMNGTSDTYYGDYSGNATHYVDLTDYEELRVYCKDNNTGFRCFFINSDYVYTGTNDTGNNTTSYNESHASVTWNATGGYYSMDLSQIAKWNNKVALKSIKAENGGSKLERNVSNIVVYNTPAANVPQYTLTGSGFQLAETVAALADATATCIDATGVTGITTNSIGGRTLLTSANPNCLFLGSTGDGHLANTQNVVNSDACANLVLADNHPFKAPSDFTATTATYTTTINTTAKAGTLCLPFAATIPEGVTAYTLAYTSGNEATATPVSGTIDANTPVLLNGNGSATFTGANVAIVADAANTEGAMTGVFEQGYVPQNSYVLQNQTGGLGFYKVAAEETITIKPFRAYLTAQNAGARLSIKFVDNDEPTGIENLTPALYEGEGAVYDLQGRRVEKATKGLYIKNGKKVIIK